MVQLENLIWKYDFVKSQSHRLSKYLHFKMYKKVLVSLFSLQQMNPF